MEEFGNYTDQLTLNKKFQINTDKLKSLDLNIKQFEKDYEISLKIDEKTGIFYVFGTIDSVNLAIDHLNSKLGSHVGSEFVSLNLGNLPTFSIFSFFLIFLFFLFF